MISLRSYVTAVPQKDSISPWNGSLKKNLLAADRRLWEARPRGELSGNARLYRREGAPPTNIKYFCDVFMGQQGSWVEGLVLPCIGAHSFFSHSPEGEDATSFLY